MTTGLEGMAVEKEIHINTLLFVFRAFLCQLFELRSTRTKLSVNQFAGTTNVNLLCWVLRETNTNENAQRHGQTYFSSRKSLESFISSTSINHRSFLSHQCKMFWWFFVCSFSGLYLLRKLTISLRSSKLNSIWCIPIGASIYLAWRDVCIKSALLTTRKTLRQLKKRGNSF